MKSLSIVLVIIVLSLVAVGPAFAMDGRMQPRHGPQSNLCTIASCTLRTMGHITNQGVANALMSKLDAAQAALDRGQPAVAANILQAFIHQVEAQSGKHIVPEHAAHLIEHAQAVVAAL